MMDYKKNQEFKKGIITDFRDMCNNFQLSHKM